MNKRFSEALSAQSKNDFSVAEALLTELIQDYPQLSEPYVNLASVYSKTNQLEKAQTTLVNGLNANPTTAALYESLQQILGAQAAEAYQKAFSATAAVDVVPLDLPLVTELSPLPQTEPSPTKGELELANQRLDSAKQEMENLKTQYELRIASLQEELANQAMIVSNSVNSVVEPQVAQIDTTPRPEPTVVTTPTEPEPVTPEPVTPEPVKPVQVAVADTQQQIDAEKKRQERIAAQALAEKREKNAINAVQRWAAAWSSQDVQSYVANYVDGYIPRGSGLSHNQWVSQRRDRLGNKKFINVKVSRFKIKDLGGRFSVRFSQNYKSNTINDTITKTLVFEKREDDWSDAKIVNENVVSG